jgi:threonine dehydrogenase-like Zn-dependent dehydrogenase
MMGNVNKPPYLTGGFAEYCYVYPTAARVKVPEEIKNDWASAASCALRTVMSAFERLGEIRHTESVVIQGDGPLGLFAAAVSRIKGPQKIIVIGGATKRLELAKSWGADETISIIDAPNPREREELVKSITGGRGGDIVFEFSGAKTAFAEGLGLIAAGGRYVVVGQLGGHHTEITPAVIVKKQVNIYGTNSAAVRHYYQALEFMKQYSGKFNFDLMITGRYKMSQINEAIESMRQFQDIKAVLDI